MGIIEDLGIAKDLAAPIDAVGSLYTTDKARIDAETKLDDVLQKPTLTQLANNAILNQSSNIFKAGWESFIGWTAGFLVLLYYAPQIIITTILWAHLSVVHGTVLAFPMRPDDILNLVYLLFGFGVHSFLSGVAKKY